MTHLLQRLSLPGSAMALLLFSLAPVHAVENNLHFSGALVNDPCDLDPDTTDLAVDFGPVIEKDFYLRPRIKPVSFTITLIGCDTSLGNTVTLTFDGNENAAVPGALAVSGTASGIAVALERTDGTPLPINLATPSFALSPGSTSITLMARVVGEPEAVKNQSITPGDFTGIATFRLDYQ